jgi:mannose-1-phosphate guanylyltransferase
VETKEGIHIIIMAGGVGTRLWPISRRSRPKQFQPLLSEHTMLVDTYRRILPLASPEHVWVVTGADFVDLVRGQLPDLPPQHVLGEPVGRNSAPAVTLATARIARSEPGATVLATPADSYIGDPDAYRDYVGVAAETAAQGFIVTLGVIPTHPETAYGYIKRGHRLGTVGGAYRVDTFTEKPDLETAERYLADGGYYWNMGHFIFQAGNFMERCAVHLPEVAAAMGELAESDDPTGELLAKTYEQLPSVSIDYGIAEKEEDMAVVPTAVEWSDVGHWRAVKEIAGRHGSLDLKSENHIAVESRNCFVMAGSGRLVVTVGVEDYVIVDTDDAVLIVHEDKAQQVRDALEEIEKRRKGDYL